MRTSRDVVHPKSNPRSARRICSIEAKPVACLECIAATPFGSFRGRTRCDPAPAQKSFDAEGEALERALTKSLRIRNDAIKSLCSSVRRFRDGLSRRNAKATIRTHFRLCGTRWNGRMPCTTTEHDGASPSFEALPVC
jgi:hypothetical protein